jgi:hypothetical protein
MNFFSKTTRSALIASALCVATASGLKAQSALVTVAESPTSQATSVANTQTYDFNSLTAGTTYNNLSWSGVGTFDTIHILAANQYGGAGGAGNYQVESASSSLGGIQTTTLTLNQASGYFGFDWTAGDGSNLLKFYNGSTLVAQYSTQSLLNSGLPTTYNGNPNNRSLDSAEKFAFINFYGQNGLTFDKIVFQDTASSGFEADNFTVAVGTNASSTNGIVVGTVTGTSTVVTAFAAPAAPAPPLTLCLAFAGVLVLQAFRRSRSAA